LVGGKGQTPGGSVKSYRLTATCDEKKGRGLLRKKKERMSENKGKRTAGRHQPLEVEVFSRGRGGKEGKHTVKMSQQGGVARLGGVTSPSKRPHA